MHVHIFKHTYKCTYKFMNTRTYKNRPAQLTRPQALFPNCDLVAAAASVIDCITVTSPETATASSKSQKSQLYFYVLVNLAAS